MGERIGPYEIVDKIATGGMADIFLALHMGPEGVERKVVLKTLRPSDADDDERVTMFLDEARLMSTLSHPHIAQVFGLEELDGAFHIVMEYVPGPTLQQMLAASGPPGSRKLPLTEALGILLAVTEALLYIHTRRDELGRPLGVVHRDLTPANVVVSYDGAVKLIDFGIAKAETKVHETRTGAIKGTPGYMAPEQVEGDPIDQRADIFTLGVLLYEMTVGGHPFGKAGGSGKAAPSWDYAAPSRIVPDYPRDLEALVAQCLAVDPGQRPSDLGAVRDALVRQLMAGEHWPTMGRLALVVHSLLPSEAEHATIVQPPSQALGDGAPQGRRRRGRRFAWSPVAWTTLVLAALGLAAFFVGRMLGGA